MDQNVGRLETSIGKDSLELGLGLLSGVGAGAGAGARFVPGVICREMPTVGFKFFSENAISKAFPLRSREFEVADLEPLGALRSGKSAQVAVREVLGHNRAGEEITGPEKQLLVGHRESLSQFSAAKSCDMLATCRPELLEPMLRAKAILQHATDVELQIDAGARRLRFLTADKTLVANVADGFAPTQRFAPSERFTPSERFMLGKNDEMSVAKFCTELQTNQTLRDAVPPSILSDLRSHSLPEVVRAFENLPYKIAGVIGVGHESIVFALSPKNDAPIFVANGISPTDVVLKISDPKYAQVDESFGTRPFDARRIGEFEFGSGSNYVAYLQEMAEPVGMEEIADSDLFELQQQMRNERVALYDQHDGHKQLGYTKDGRLVVIDWFAVLSKQICNRPEELLDDFRPSK